MPRRVQALQKEIAALREQVAAGPQPGELSADKLLADAVEVAGVRVVVAEARGASPNVLRQLIDQLRKNASPVAVLLGGGSGDKVLLVAGLSRDLVERGADAGRWVREAAQEVGGSGGGKPDMAQAGGKHPDRLPDALEKARAVIADMLG